MTQIRHRHHLLKAFGEDAACIQDLIDAYTTPIDQLFSTKQYKRLKMRLDTEAANLGQEAPSDREAARLILTAAGGVLQKA